MSLESEAEEKVFFTQAKMVWTQMLLKSSSIQTFCWLWPKLSCFYLRLWLFCNFFVSLVVGKKRFVLRQMRVGDENSPKRITKLNKSAEFVPHFLIMACKHDVNLNLLRWNTNMTTDIIESENNFRRKEVNIDTLLIILSHYARRLDFSY